MLSSLVAVSSAPARDDIQGLVEKLPHETTIIVLGDSLSAGYGIELKDAWPSLMQTRIRDFGYPIGLVNSSISGETTKGGLSRIDKLLATHQPKLVLVELGANDALRGVPAKHAQKNLVRIVDKIIESGAEALVFEMIVPPNYGQAFTAQYEQMYAEVAEMDHVELVPFFLGGVIFEPGMMQADGLHPTASAQPQLLEEIWPYVDEKIHALNLAAKPAIEMDSGEACRQTTNVPEHQSCEELGENNEFL